MFAEGSVQWTKNTWGDMQTKEWEQLVGNPDGESRRLFFADIKVRVVVIGSWRQFYDVKKLRDLCAVKHSKIFKSEVFFKDQ